MKTIKLFAYVLLIGLLLALAGSVGLSLAQGPEPPPGEVQSQGEVSITATVGSRFSYQGVLKENGSPVTGSRDMIFRLYLDDTCSTQLGGDIIRNAVPVTDGLFNVELDVTHSYFDGQGLWLEVEVGGTPIGCQEILPVPYALSLRPGALIYGAESYARLANRTGMSPPYMERGVEGRSEGADSDTDYYGVYGYGTDAGIYGESDSGYGVYGSSADDYAGHFEGYSGVFAEGIYYGVYAQSTGIYPSYGLYASGNSAAIYGDGDVMQSRASNGLVKAAVSAYCQGPTGSGIYRYFNNVTSDLITIADGASEGRCTIDFTFDISDRFWVVTAEHDEARGVSCQLGNSNTELDCIRWRADTGAAFGGPIMVLIY